MNKQEQIVMAINDLYNKVAWLNKLKLAESFQNDNFQIYTSSEISCIEYIGNNVDSNVTRLAESSYMTRSALSKMTKKLIKKGIIERYQKPENKKEIYFRLTEKGKEIYTIHEDMTNRFIERDKSVFEQVPVEQLDSMLCFFDRYSRHLDAEIKQMDIDNE